MDILHYEFMRNALAGGILAAVACGMIGAYVVVNRISFVSGAMSHTAFGGVGLGYFLGINPLWGAGAFTLAAAVAIGLLGRGTGQRIDTMLGIMWAIGMALGIIFIRLTPGYAPDLMSWLFGSILTIPRSDLVLMLVLDIIMVALVVLLFKEFMAISFDEEQARIAGLPVERLYLLLLCMIAVTIVILMQIVGIILVISLLTIPAATSSYFTKSLRGMMLLSIVFGMVFNTAGLWFSYIFNLPSGATIIIVSGIVFLAASAYKKFSARRGAAK